jgi:hypothetical protein
MRRTITLLAATFVVAVGIAGSASAATLYTNAAHTTPVAVGTTLTASHPSGVFYYMYYASGGTLFDACADNALIVKVTQNSGGVFKAGNVDRILSSCANPWGGTSSGTLQISGSATTVGSNKSWASTTLSDSSTIGGSIVTENFSGAGVSAQQPTSGGTPLSIVLDHAGTMTAGVQNLKASGTYQFNGSYSLG